MDFSMMVRAELVLGAPKFAEVSQDVRKFFFFSPSKLLKTAPIIAKINHLRQQTKGRNGFGDVGWGRLREHG
jgi:hypothetical protein